MSQETEKLYTRFLKVKEQRQNWESLWQECYDYALPQKNIFNASCNPKTPDKLFDATAADAVDQLASSMFAELTPAWSKWFNLAVGIDNFTDDDILKKLNDAVEIMQYHFDRSNFALEVHQCYLDLVTVGTASLLFEEAKIGETSAFKFTAVPISELYIDESGSGRLDITFRSSYAGYDILRTRFQSAVLPDDFIQRAKEDSSLKVNVIEAVVPRDNGGYEYTAFIAEGCLDGFVSDMPVLKQGVFETSPFINFRWQKVPGETYGRSLVMKALPDIKTANKVVELILKNAAISVTGIWQAEDDGVLNPANIRLVPGSIIPKAVGSKGLTPLEAPGNFDVSQLVLTDLRTRIRHALLNDRLGQINTPQMTATEVLERSAEMARILGATYGRLQSELLTPVILRAASILCRRGEISPLFIDGRLTKLEYASPLARKQAQQDVSNILSWLDSVKNLGEAGVAAVNLTETARWLGKSLGVPPELVKDKQEAATTAVISSAVSMLANTAAKQPQTVKTKRNTRK